MSTVAPERVHVALGSNLGDRAAALGKACDALRALSSDGRLRCSPLYESAPMGPSDQPDYLNAVCAFTTSLAPQALLAALQRIENAAGRVRPAVRWSARTLDLDLLLYGARRIDTPDLTVPHPGIAERTFVLMPLHDLDASLDVPGQGAVSTLLAALDTDGIRRLPESEGAAPWRT